MAPEAAGQPRMFLSNLLAGAGDRRRAGASIVVFVAIFAALAPFAQIPLPRVWAFIPCYQAALVVNDLITAMLLLGQCAILRSRALLALALGYLFTALMAVAHGLTFPGLFAPGGLLGAGPQTTAWLYMAWHSGFPLAVIAYVLGSGGEHCAPRPMRQPRAAIASGAAAVIAAVCGLTLLATAGQSALPAIMAGSHYTGAMLGTVGTVWALSLAALLALLWRRPHSVLDLWLIVVIVAWLCDIGLSAVLNAGRFDLGFYAGRIFGLLAASFVLIVLLLETGALYARLASAFEREAAERETRLDELRQELIHVSRLNELGHMVSGLAHELNQPLAAAGNYLAAAQVLARGADPARVEQVLRRAAEQIQRAGHVIERLRRLARKGEVERRPDNLATTIEEAIALALAGGYGRGVELRMSLDPAVPAVLIDRVQIQQVLLNLLRNAIEAMADAARRELVVAAAPAADGMVEISVADSGPGLEDAVRERLFHPFVTTKAAGMGVGLSICRSIIEAHGGRIWTTDNPGGGTVFHFTVQCAAEIAPPSAAAAPRPALAPG